MDQLIGDDAYNVGYNLGYGPDGNLDLEVSVSAYNLAHNALTGAGGPILLWQGDTTILDFAQGDYGLNVTASPDYEEAVKGQITQSQYQADEQALATPYIANAKTSNYVDDDRTAVWQGVFNGGANVPSVSTLTTDLKSLLAATGAPTS